MRRIMTLVGAALLAVTLTGVAEAKQCKDDKGKFIKCPPAAATPAPKQVCKNAKGKFAKCGTPGAVPVKGK